RPKLHSGHACTPHRRITFTGRSSARPAFDHSGRSGVAVMERVRLRHVPALDGLRGVAVVAVVLYHAGLKIPGGFLGVDVFFVISGYLITSLLLAEWSARHSADLAAFWRRRLRRILPAVTTLIVA